ncbi:MAG: sphingosine kinase, partial [Geodermatophilaceae bacterium]|nr:sphingosine kinase [Geodermatophilaceae bacterium]
DHLDHPAVSRHRVSALRLDAPGVTAYADGEPVGALPLDLVCRPGMLRVIAPS